LALKAESDVGVDAGRHSDVGVPQKFLDHDEVDALLQEQGGRRVAQVVEADAAEPRPVEESAYCPSSPSRPACVLLPDVPGGSSTSGRTRSAGRCGGRRHGSWLAGQLGRRFGCAGGSGGRSPCRRRGRGLPSGGRGVHLCGGRCAGRVRTARGAGRCARPRQLNFPCVWSWSRYPLRAVRDARSWPTYVTGPARSAT
jgi:hypothetical protein